MARPQSASDAEIVVRIASYLTAREWPAASWTLADIAPAAGLSPAGIVKRFGSRAGLLRALGAHWLQSIPTEVRGDASPREELRQFARSAFAAASPDAATMSLADLFADLGSESQAAVLREGYERQRRYCSLLLTALDHPSITHPDRAAQLLLDALHGSLIRHAAGDKSAADPDQLVSHFLEIWT